MVMAAVHVNSLTKDTVRMCVCVCALGGTAVETRSFKRHNKVKRVHQQSKEVTTASGDNKKLTLHTIFKKYDKVRADTPWWVGRSLVLPSKRRNFLIYYFQGWEG